MTEHRSTASPSRRRLIGAAASTLAVAGVFGVGLREARAGKIAKTAVAYRDSPDGDRRCANCALFEAPAACRSVDGAISPQGWCRIWVKKPG